MTGRARAPRERGATAVEFALVLLPLLLLLLGMLDYGWYFYVDLTATNAVREAAREATLYAGGCPNAAGIAAGRSRAINYMSRINMDSYTTVDATCTADATGPLVQFTVNVDFPRLTGAPLVPMPGGSATGRTAVHTHATMRGVP
jgi:Flp pilus assembly protein TadG